MPERYGVRLLQTDLLHGERTMKLIVEMWMPSRCPCVLAVDNNGWFSPCFAEHGIPSRTKDFDDCIEKGTRPDWCPIVGVLPEEHGDLIDRRLLCKDIVEAITTRKGTLSEVIEKQKAVIAAERKDDGTTAD